MSTINPTAKIAYVTKTKSEVNMSTTTTIVLSGVVDTPLYKVEKAGKEFTKAKVGGQVLITEPIGSFISNGIEYFVIDDDNVLGVV